MSLEYCTVKNGSVIFGCFVIPAPAFARILFKLKAGCPWRDVPDYFGNWNSIYKRFNECSLKDKLKNIFLLSHDHDNEWTFIDGSIVKAHQHSSGAAYGAPSAIGKSVVGNSTKIHLPVCFTITGGEVHDSKEAQNLINQVPELEILIADKGYDRDILRTNIENQGAQSFIPRKINSKNGTIYIGVTNNLAKRVWEHKNNMTPGLSSKYKVNNLVYYESHIYIESSIIREKVLKKWNRQWKSNLIEKENSKWLDLAENGHF